MISKTGIHWFRQDLRIHDNPALLKCLSAVERFIPIFIFDGETGGTDLCGYNRFRFLLQSLNDLAKQFKKQKIDFMCFHGKPHEIIKNLILEWQVEVLSFSKDSETRMNTRDNLVYQVCQQHNVLTIEIASYTLYDPNTLMISNDVVPMSVEEFMTLCKEIGDPAKPIPPPDFKSLNLLCTLELYNKQIHKIPDLEFFKIVPECVEQENCLFPGGETKAMTLFKRRLELEKISFSNGKINPNKLKPIIFTEEISLSPYLRFGCLSPKLFYWEISEVFNKNYKSGQYTIIEATEQLFWREYFYQLSFQNMHFCQIDKNPMAFKIPWEWNKIMFEKWQTGRTGIPWIDACMRQLRTEGWIHHICRNSVAIFLTRGDMFMSWENGLKTFLKYLVDADWSICAGNWNYIASGDPEAITDPANLFCPVMNGKKIDPEGVYVRKYVPELKNFDNEYLFEPWKAPFDVQEDAGCIIGRDYPQPILDHEQAFQENVDKLKQFYNSLNKFNNNFVSESYKSYTFKKFLEDELINF